MISGQITTKIEGVVGGLHPSNHGWTPIKCYKSGESVGRDRRNTIWTFIRGEGRKINISRNQY
jgi:hypothetical protein